MSVNLIIDIGNTTAKLAAFDQEKMVAKMHTSNRTLAGLDAFAQERVCTRGIVSSVVELTEEARAAIDALPFRPLWLDGRTPLPIANRYRTPETLGTDRIAAAVGAQAQFPGRNILLIDAGTCITYELIGAEGEYLGGNIAPGRQMRLNALHAFTGKLPQVEADGDTPDVGHDTETAIRAGVMKGIQYEMEGYIHHFKLKYANLLVFLTGGDDFYFDICPKSGIFADKFVVPKGLNRILEYNDTI